VKDNDYPDGTPVQVRYPVRQDSDNRAAWPWLPGTIVQQCGPGEWQVRVDAPELAMLEDGRAAPPGTPDGDLFYPTCFRDSSDIRRAAS
jgi:hypothetical protein